ncbi:hypothetical protein [Anaerosinus massiliensis]|uniref:hypothetical protein n=1 Tax=Massilibacillus massiliensis TaxID=1806837 RepID=UPI000DA60463|nr:hypothetical protein [Massilibacillus massiliensis]
MKHLLEYLHKTLKVTCIDDQIIVGEVTDYTCADDNKDYQDIDSDSFSISQTTSDGEQYGVELYQNEIKSIEILI